MATNDLISQGMNSTTMGADGRPLKGFAAGGFNAQGQFQQNPGGAVQSTAPQQAPAPPPPSSIAGIPGTPGGTANQAAVQAGTTMAQQPESTYQNQQMLRSALQGQQGQPQYGSTDGGDPYEHRMGSLISSRMGSMGEQPNQPTAPEAPIDPQAQAAEMLSGQSGSNSTLQPMQSFSRGGQSGFGSRQPRLGGLQRRLY